MVKAYSRGWEIYYDGKNWRYVDNNEIINDSRPCKKCGRKPTKEGYDACLGHIPGVESACCGHGVEKPYITIHSEHIGMNTKVYTGRSQNTKLHSTPLRCKIRRFLVPASPTAVMYLCTFGLIRECKKCKNCSNNRRSLWL